MTTMIELAVAQRRTTVREAFRHHRLAQRRRRLWMYYLEHNLFDEAQDARQSMMKHLRCACRQWRLTLDGPPAAAADGASEAPAGR